MRLDNLAKQPEKHDHGLAIPDPIAFSRSVMGLGQPSDPIRERRRRIQTSTSAVFRQGSRPRGELLNVAHGSLAGREVPSAALEVLKGLVQPEP
jgi:hypothetical protein